MAKKCQKNMRLREVEKSITESEGKSSGLVTAKDVFVVLCGIAARKKSILLNFSLH